LQYRLICTVYFNCHVTEADRRNGIQDSKTFPAAALDLKPWLDLRLISMDEEPR
jgi:hypothetical protein